MKKTPWLAVLFFFLFNSFASAKLFKNSYVSFELPPNWKCTQEGYEHVCVNAFSKKAKEAIIILTAKKRGSQDNLQNYEAHLKKPRSMSNYKGVKYTSKVKAVRKRKLAGVDWVDGIQLGSEVQGYYTRYVGTVKGGIGILVTFSAHRDHYTKYSNDFIRAIQSLRVIASKELLAGGFAGGGTYSKKRDLFGQPLMNSLPEGMYEDFAEEGQQSNGGGLFALLGGAKGVIGILLLLLGGIGFAVYQKSR